MARITKAQRAALAAQEASAAQQEAPAAPWNFPKGAEIEAQRQAAAAFFASRQQALDAAQQNEETISDDEIARQQAEAEAAYDKTIQDAIEASQADAAAKGSKKIYIKQSSIKLPTKAAWAIYSAMRAHAEKNELPYPSRGECIAEAIKAGIASGTSATQYQYWKKHFGY